MDQNEDYRARKLAKAEGLEIRGSVGLLETFYLRRYLTDLRRAFQQLLTHMGAARGGKNVEVLELRAQQSAIHVEHDPLANLRKVEASRPGFHFRGTENLDVLVHGRRESREQSKR